MNEQEQKLYDALMDYDSPVLEKAIRFLLDNNGIISSRHGHMRIGILEYMERHDGAISERQINYWRHTCNQHAIKPRLHPYVKRLIKMGFEYE